METDPEDVFRTEVLCQWVTSLNTAISADVWASLANLTAERARSVTFALDVATDQSSATVAVAWRGADGLAQLSIADHRPGVDWVITRAVELARTWGYAERSRTPSASAGWGSRSTGRGSRRRVVVSSSKAQGLPRC